MFPFLCRDYSHVHVYPPIRMLHCCTASRSSIGSKQSSTSSMAKHPIRTVSGSSKSSLAPSTLRSADKHVTRDTGHRQSSKPPPARSNKRWFVSTVVLPVSSALLPAWKLSDVVPLLPSVQIGRFHSVSKCVSLYVIACECVVITNHVAPCIYRKVGAFEFKSIKPLLQWDSN